MSFGFGLSFGFWRVGDKGKLEFLRKEMTVLEKKTSRREGDKR